MPFLPSPDCRLTTAGAANLAARSQALHRYIRDCTPEKGPVTKLDPGRLCELLTQQRQDGHNWCCPEALPTLLQILQAEDTNERLLLVDLVGRIEGPNAAAVLAARALFDVSSDVRQAAIRELAQWRPETYRSHLLEGLRYPWPPAAAHAAEALVALRDKEAIPILEALFDAPPTGMPSPESGGLQQSPVVRELVRINHRKNCLLCHPPSFKETDFVRGIVPAPGRPASSASVYYQGTPEDLFVRADITYLRQDFSLQEPTSERFDYLVRVRAADKTDWLRFREKETRLIRQHREPIVFALRELGEIARRERQRAE
jgi:hypothetical protein